MENSNEFDSDYDIKMQIVAALADLMKSSPLEKITVKSICDRAGISRTTFYNHFKDKYDVIQWHALLIAKISIYQGGRTMSLHDAYTKNFNEMLKYRDFYVTTYRSKKFSDARKNIVEARRQSILQTIKDYKHVEPSESLMFKIDYVSNAEPEMVANWIIDGMVTPVDTMVDLLLEVLPKDLRKLMDL